MTPKERAAMQQALEALENERSHMTANWDNIVKAITALREALAEQAEQRSDSERMEPVATMEVFSGWGDEANFEQLPFDLPDGVYKLYAAPVRTKDLTDDEIHKCDRATVTRQDFARAVIAAYKEKNK